MSKKWAKTVLKMLQNEWKIDEKLSENGKKKTGNRQKKKIVFISNASHLQSKIKWFSHQKQQFSYQKQHISYQKQPFSHQKQHISYRKPAHLPVISPLSRRSASTCHGSAASAACHTATQPLFTLKSPKSPLSGENSPFWAEKSPFSGENWPFLDENWPFWGKFADFEARMSRRAW
jgi:hypothetical protein